MKDGVDGSERIGESKSKGMGAGLCNDVIGSEILFRELLRSTSGVEMFGFDEYLIANLEVWCWRSVFIGRDLVLFLGVGDRRLELLVKQFGGCEIFKIFVVGDNIDQKSQTFVVVSPNFEGFKDCE